jgi:hypothetical protein
MGGLRARVSPTACAPVAVHVCTKGGNEVHCAAPGPSAAHACTEDDEAYRTAAPGPSRTCASWEATGLGARNLWWRVGTVAWPFAAGGWRLAAAAAAAARRAAIRKQKVQPTPSRSWYLGASGWQPVHDSRSFPLANTSYERPAPWPPTMHKCARDPALPCGTLRRPLCTRVQRWDPALHSGPRCRPWCTHGQRRARTQLDSRVHPRPPWSVWPGKSSRMVTKPG